MVMIIVGAKENKRYTITAEPIPVLVKFSSNNMKEVNMREYAHHAFTEMNEPCHHQEFYQALKNINVAFNPKRAVFK
jgi:hypothetical protein